MYIYIHILKNRSQYKPEILCVQIIMEVASVLCMNGGIGENSYANNSLLQKAVILKARSFVKDSIKELFGSSKVFPTCITVADLGCSSGPNTLQVMYEIIGTIHELCLEQPKLVKSLELQLFLNDLPENDFNTVFKALPDFFERLRKEKGPNLGSCFVSGRPGSFYERLFPSKSVHFVHSSYSVHWLSQVPYGITNNKGNAYISKSSPPNVVEAYKEQFTSDFSKFLRLRGEELLPGGSVVLTFIGRSSTDPACRDCCSLWDLLANSLLQLVTEGIVDASDVDSFNIPHYIASEEEIRSIVEEEGSFYMEKLEVFETPWDPRYELVRDDVQSGRNVANALRSTTETLLAVHFGEDIIDRLFEVYSKEVTNLLSLNAKAKFDNFLICLRDVHSFR